MTRQLSQYIPRFTTSNHNRSAEHKVQGVYVRVMTSYILVNIRCQFTKTDVQKTDVQNLVIYRMDRQIRITAVCYIDPPWNDPHELVVHHEEAMDERTLFHWHLQRVISWERRWRAFNAQGVINIFGAPRLARPTLLPLCTCVPLLDPVVYAEDLE